MAYQREYPRYDHVYISLKLQNQVDWHWVKVYNWSQEGFNFLFDSPIDIGEPIQFKKALDTFEGNVVWEKKQLTNEDMLFMSMNRLLTHKFMEKFDTHRLDPDFLELLRDNNVVEKLDYAQKYLGFFVSRSMMLEEIEKNHWSKKQQYGIHIDDPRWVEIFHKAMNHSAPLIDIEKSIDQKIDKLATS